MAINSVNLQTRMAFGSNPYNEQSPFKEMEDRTLGKVFLGLARKGSQQLLEECNGRNDAEGLANSKIMYDFLLQKEADYSPEGIEKSEQLGKFIRTFA